MHDELTGAVLDPVRPLVWRRRVPLFPNFELHQGDSAFGGMEAALRDDMDAEGECFGRTLAFRLETGLFRRVLVETYGSEEEGRGPTFRGPNFGWGRITTPKGEVLQWRHSLVRLYTHILLDGAGIKLLHLRPTFFRLGRTETRVLLTPEGGARSDLPEILLMTWFLRAHTEVGGRRVFRKARRRRSRNWILPPPDSEA